MGTWYAAQGRGGHEEKSPSVRDGGRPGDEGSKLTTPGESSPGTSGPGRERRGPTRTPPLLPTRLTHETRAASTAAS